MLDTMLLTTLAERLSQVNVILGIIFAAIGIAIACLARRIACAARKTSNVKNDDMIMITCKVVGLIMIVVALIVLIIM